MGGLPKGLDLATQVIQIVAAGAVLAVLLMATTRPDQRVVGKILIPRFQSHAFANPVVGSGNVLFL